MALSVLYLNIQELVTIKRNSHGMDGKATETGE